MNSVVSNVTHAGYPAHLRERLGTATLPHLFCLGNLNLLALFKTALFCSARCPGDAILAAYDQAARWREEGQCIISGFHSSVEKECLRILLRGKSPIIICPARSLHGMRLPAAWQKALSDGRLLLLSPFPDNQRRATAQLAKKRNSFVATLADEISAPYASPGGNLENLLHGLRDKIKIQAHPADR